jgi:UDP-N-acetylmuramoyl-tripeptide--D-alanyl-D-alanine ligase
MWASKKGDIKYLCDIADPTQGLITNVSMAHTEFFNDLDTIQSTKGELFDFIDANGGKIYVNLDDSRVEAQAEKFSNTIGFGFEHDSSFKYQLAGPDELGCYTLEYSGQSIHLTHPGKALALNAAAAMTIALSNGMDTETISDALIDYPGESGRMQLLRVSGVSFIHDAYNANPASTELGIETVKSMRPASRKILIFADMLELGEHSHDLHKKIGEYIIDADFDYVFLCGLESTATAYHLDNNGYTSFYHNVEKAATIQRFLRVISEGDLVYLKGSRGMKLEDFIEAYKEQK